MNYAYQDLQCLMGLQRVPQAEVILQAWVHQNQLDLVHVHNTLFYGLWVLSALSFQFPTLVTLHDYWPLDPLGRLWDESDCSHPYSPATWALKAKAAWPSVFERTLESMSYYAEARMVASPSRLDLMRLWISFSLRCLASCRHVIATSKASAVTFRKYGLKMSTIVVENDVDVSVLQNGLASEAEADRWHGSRIRLGLLGNIASEKGQLAFCKACLHPELAVMLQVALFGQF